MINTYAPFFHAVFLDVLKQSTHFRPLITIKAINLSRNSKELGRGPFLAFDTILPGGQIR